MRPARVKRAVVVAVAFAGVASSATVRASAGDIDIDLPPPSGVGLVAGPWSGFGEASGRAAATERGVTVSWDGSIPAQFEFTISTDSDEDPGEAFGTWQHQGSAVMQLASGQLPGPVTASLDFVGGGDVGGRGEVLTLTGNARTTGVVTIAAGKRNFTSTVDNPSQPPTLTLQVVAASCNQAFGEWAYTVEHAFEGEGFTATFDGFWVASRNVEVIDEQLKQVLDVIAGVLDIPEGVNVPNEFTRMSAQTLYTYNALVDTFPAGWTIDSVLELLATAEMLANTWRNLTGCARELFGATNVETFISGLTLVVQGLIIGGSQLEGLTSQAWTQLAHAGARSGAFGAGAENPSQAVAAEQALIDAGERILEANVDPADGQIFVNDDTVRVMTTGAAMGWEYTVNGQVYDAQGSYELLFGEPAPPIEGDG